MKPKIFFFASILFAVTDFTHIRMAGAASYELIKGKEMEMCEAYKKNLNSFSHLPYPMACERKINSEMKDFKKPEWKEMDIWENRELIKNIEKIVNGRSGDPDKNLEEWEKNLKWRIETRNLSIGATKVDIDNDGKGDDVIKYYDGQCGSTHLYGIPIFILNEKLTLLDVKKSEYLFQHGGKAKERPFDGWHYAMYDIFLYKGRVFFDMWSNSQSDTGFLHVYKTENKHTKEICTYRYHEDKQN